MSSDAQPARRRRVSATLGSATLGSATLGSARKSR